MKTIRTNRSEEVVEILTDSWKIRDLIEGLEALQLFIEPDAIISVTPVDSGHKWRIGSVTKKEKVETNV